VTGRPTASTAATTRAPVRVLPADRVDFRDLQLVLGARGQASRCQCQRYRLAPGESFAGTAVEDRRHRLQEQTSCDEPGGSTTSGLVALRGDVPVGWCAVAPRTAYRGLARQQVPWLGRYEDATDTSVWAVTCVLVRAGHRRQGVSGALVAAAVEHARDGGARRLEAYPMTTTQAVTEELHCGLLGTFLAAGFTEVLRPTARRAVVQVDLEGRRPRARTAGERP
jgi:GNAT superfamily N-acetyltransferase